MCCVRVCPLLQSRKNIYVDIDELVVKALVIAKNRVEVFDEVNEIKPCDDQFTIDGTQMISAQAVIALPGDSPTPPYPLSEIQDN